jgi:hypothetical protein
VAKAKSRKKRSVAGRLVRLFLRLTRALILMVALAGIWSAGFIGARCYSGTPSPDVTETPLERETSPTTVAHRQEASTYLTLPEWYIVYNTDEYARALATRPPSAFAYVGSVRQYWRYYGAACDATKGVYPFSRDNHVMLAVIGSSFSFEYALKGLYENTFGRLSEWVGGYDTPEDAFARTTAAEYGTFMHTLPWYEFPFAQKVRSLWTTTPSTGPHMLRKWERRFALTAEYGVKAGYGWLIGRGSHATYAREDLTVEALLENAGPEVFTDGVVKRVRDSSNGRVVVAIPRYEAFTARALMMLQQGARFVNVAGNDEILITLLVPSGWTAPDGYALILDDRLLSDVTTRRVALKAPVTALHLLVPKLQASGARVEHLYDY